MFSNVTSLVLRDSGTDSENFNLIRLSLCQMARDMPCKGRIIYRYIKKQYKMIVHKNVYLSPGLQPFLKVEATLILKEIHLCHEN